MVFDFSNQYLTLGELNSQFNSHFTNLCLRFFQVQQPFDSKPHGEELAYSSTLQEVRRVFSKGQVAFHPSTTVAELEKSLRLMLGLSVQVFRKSGKTWIETGATDHWTLQKQQEIATDSQIDERQVQPDYGLRDPE